MRKALHLCVGARVMLTQNRLWDVPTVPLGLMNGARGIVVAILYAAPGSARADGNELAGTGFPTTTLGSFPRGLDQCHLPGMVVVHYRHIQAHHALPISRARGYPFHAPRPVTRL